MRGVAAFAWIWTLFLMSFLLFRVSIRMVLETAPVLFAFSALQIALHLAIILSLGYLCFHKAKTGRVFRESVWCDPTRTLGETPGVDFCFWCACNRTASALTSQISPGGTSCSSPRTPTSAAPPRRLAWRRPRSGARSSVLLDPDADAARAPSQTPRMSSVGSAVCSVGCESCFGWKLRWVRLSCAC